MRTHRSLPRALLSAAILALFALPFLVGCSGDGPQAIRGAPNLGGGDGGGSFNSGSGSFDSGSFDSGSFGSDSGSFDTGSQSEGRGPSVGTDSGDEGGSSGTDGGGSSGTEAHQGSGSAANRTAVANQLEALLRAIGNNDWAGACKYVWPGAISELQARRDAPAGDCKTVLAWWMNETVSDVYPSYRGATVDADQIDATSRVARVPAGAITYSPPLDDPEYQSLNAEQVDLVNQGGAWQVRTLIG